MKKTNMITFRLSDQLYDKLLKLKKEKFINTSELARHLFEKYLSEEEM